MEKITSLQNAKVKSWTKLRTKKERDLTGRFLVEGEHLTGEALKAGAVETIITSGTCPFAFDHVIEVTQPVMDKLSASVSGTDLIAVCRKSEPVTEELKRVLILDGVQDPGNLGTLVRTAVSFSFDAVFCSKDTCDLYNEKVIRSTQGALFHIPVIYADLADLCANLQREGMTVIATALDASEKMSDIPASEKMAFILGNEGQGVSRKLIDLADQRLRIEMDGFESLNVAVAGGIVMYTYRKERR